MRSPAALSVDVRPSRILLTGGGCIHALSVVAVTVCSLPLWVKAGLIVAVALSFTRFRLQYGHPFGSRFTARLELLDGRWRIETGDGKIRRAELTDGYAHPKIIILNFRLENGERWPLALLPDAADAQALRRLRVWLRTETADEASESF